MTGTECGEEPAKGLIKCRHGVGALKCLGLCVTLPLGLGKCLGLCLEQTRLFRTLSCMVDVSPDCFSALSQEGVGNHVS